MQQVFCTSAQGEREWQASRSLHGSAHAFHSQPEVIDGRITAAAGIFDGAAHQANFGGTQNGLGTVFGQVAKTVFQIGGHRQRGGIDDLAGIVQCIVQAQGAFGVRPAKAEGQACTGGSQRLETQAGEQLGGAGIPRVGDDERAVALV